MEVLFNDLRIYVVYVRILHALCMYTFHDLHSGEVCTHYITNLGISVKSVSMTILIDEDPWSSCLCVIVNSKKARRQYASRF